jgi:hypothetical protein
MKSGLTKTLPMDLAEQKGQFFLSDAQSPFKITSNGKDIAMKVVRNASGILQPTGYPALRDGPMTIQASVKAGDTVAQTAVNFNYKRPELTVPISLPIVQEFPGFLNTLAPINPLTNRTLDVATLPVVVETASIDTLKINDTVVVKDAAFNLDRKANSTGSYPTLVKDTADSEGARDVRLWVNLPDAPTIVLKTSTWNPASRIKLSQSHTTSAVKVQDVDVTAKLEGGTKETCLAMNMIRPDYTLSQTAGVNCAIRFGELPEGMKYNPYASNALRGSVPNVGPNTLSYTTGVVYTDPITRQTAFYPVKESPGALNVEGKVPEAIALSFKNDKALDTFYDRYKSHFPGKNFATVDKAQARTLGTVNVKGAYREITTRVTYPDANAKEIYSSLAESNQALVMQANTPWETNKVKVESWYKRAPEYITTQEFDFVGVPQSPMVDFEKTFVSHDQAETIIHGVVGIARGTTITFEPESMGQWQVRITEDKTGKEIASPVQLATDGTFTVNLGKLSAGTRYVVAEAQMISDGQVLAVPVMSKPRALVTAAGTAIEATLSVRSTSGRAPFYQTISANPKNATMFAAVKNVTWETLQQDGSWQRLMRSDTVEQGGVNYTAIINSPGTVTYRAVLVNKNSGAVFTTEPLTLTAFDTPTITVEAPGVVQVGKPVQFKAAAQDGFDAEFSWRLVTTGGSTDLVGAQTNTFSFTPTEIKNYAVEVTARQRGAPENPAATVTKLVSIKAVNPLVARATVKGPTYVEAGKPYTYTATINDVVSANTSKTYEVLGYWMLSDGTRIDGTELNYIPAPNDKAISYYTYVKGYPEETTVSTLPIKTWQYTWPSTWRIKLMPQLMEVPAVIRFYVETPDFDLRTLNGEPLSYTWSLPAGVQRTSGNDVTGTISVNAAGTYQLAMQVSDTRGNVTDVTSDEFTILPPPALQTQASMTSKYPEQYFAPGSYYLSLKILSMPRGDSFLRNDVLINGTKVGEFSGSGHYVAFQTPGNYTVSVRTITKAGNYGEQNLTLDVKEPPKPVCVIKQATVTSGLMLTPECTLDVGTLRTTTWTYVLDGAPQKATSKTFVVPKAWLGTTRMQDLRVSIDTDLGAIVEQSVTVQ